MRRLELGHINIKDIQFGTESKIEDVYKRQLLGFDLPSGDRVRNINIVYNKGIRLSGVTERFIRTVREVYGE